MKKWIKKVHPTPVSIRSLGKTECIPDKNYFVLPQGHAAPKLFIPYRLSSSSLLIKQFYF